MKLSAWDRRSLEEQVDALPTAIPMPGEPYSARLVVYNRNGVPEIVYEFALDSLTLPGAEIRLSGIDVDTRAPDFRECTSRKWKGDE